jgi:hypothetical protein
LRYPLNIKLVFQNLFFQDLVTKFEIINRVNEVFSCDEEACSFKT